MDLRFGLYYKQHDTFVVSARKTVPKMWDRICYIGYYGSSAGIDDHRRKLLSDAGFRNLAKELKQLGIDRPARSFNLELDTYKLFDEKLGTTQEYPCVCEEDAYLTLFNVKWYRVYHPEATYVESIFGVWFDTRRAPLSRELLLSKSDREATLEFVTLVTGGYTSKTPTAAYINAKDA